MFATRKRRPKAPVSRFVCSPHNYAGGKSRLLHKLLPEFGDLTDHTFIDLFAGGMNVGMNAGAAHTVFTDAHPQAVSIAQYLADSTPGQVECEVGQIVTEYGLSDSQSNGYGFYNTDSSKGLADHNRAPFLRLRADINGNVFVGRELQAAEFTLVMFGFNNYIQISAVDGRWVTPVGKRDCNASVRARLNRTVAWLAEAVPEIHLADFRTVAPATYSRPFVYADPPYSLGTAPYNTGWSSQDDIDLTDYLDDLTRQGIPWAMSNVFALKGERNARIEGWARRHSVIHLDFDYGNASHRRTQAAHPTEEVLIMSGVRRA